MRKLKRKKEDCRNQSLWAKTEDKTEPCKKRQIHWRSWEGLGKPESRRTHGSKSKKR